MKWLSNLFVNFVVRMIIGIALIFLVNQYFLMEEVNLRVGINLLTAVTTGALGVPGVCLLYGIVFFHGF